MKIPLLKAPTEITDSGSVFRVMKEVLLREDELSRKREHFWVIGLAANNQIEYIELISLGRLNTVHVEPLDVFNFATAKKLNRIVLVHNHPSGSLEPSAEDKELTEVLCGGGCILRIEVLDHLIITDKDYFSFRDADLLLDADTEEMLKRMRPKN